MWCVPNRWNLLYLHIIICLSSLSSTSILCTRLPGRIPFPLVSANPYRASLGLTRGPRFNNTDAWDCGVKKLPAQSTTETSMDDGIIELIVDQRREGPPGKAFSMKCLWGQCLLQPWKVAGALCCGGKSIVLQRNWEATCSKSPRSTWTNNWNITEQTRPLTLATTASQVLWLSWDLRPWHIYFPELMRVFHT